MTETRHSFYYSSPIGIIKLTSTNSTLTALSFVSEIEQKESSATPFFTTCVKQLEEYFAGRRKTFEVASELEGTPFQKMVWQAACSIPFGTRISYTTLANLVERPQAHRAVARALSQNPMLLIIPCHRVTRHDGTLAGYKGGSEKKQWLLEHEQR